MIINHWVQWGTLFQPFGFAEPRTSPAFALRLRRRRLLKGSRFKENRVQHGLAQGEPC